MAVLLMPMIGAVQLSKPLRIYGKLRPQWPLLALSSLHSWERACTLSIKGRFYFTRLSQKYRYTKYLTSSKITRLGMDQKDIFTIFLH